MVSKHLIFYEADDITDKLKLWTYVGEWSLALDILPTDPPRKDPPKAFTLWEQQGLVGYEKTKMDEFQKNVAYRAYGAAQLASFERYKGWFFWSYKIEIETEAEAPWSFRECVKRGWLPSFV